MTRLLVPLASAVGVVAMSAPASAAPYQCQRSGGEYRAHCAQVTGKDGGGVLELQNEPRYGRGTVVGAGYSNGDELVLDCWAQTEASDDGDPYWFHVYDPNDHAVTGYVNDHYLTTGAAGDWKPLVEPCSSVPPPPGGGGGPGDGGGSDDGGACASPAHEDWFPGTDLPPYRLGRVDVNITACPTDPPSQWTVDASSSENSLGATSGYEIVTRVVNQEIQSHSRDTDVDITLRACAGGAIKDLLPFKLCHTEDRWRLKYHLALSGGDVVETRQGPTNTPFSYHLYPTE